MNITQEKNVLTVDSLAELVLVHQPPCLSLYQSTHRRHPENQQDLIRFGYLVKELEASLRQTRPTSTRSDFFEPSTGPCSSTLPGLRACR
jgi:hypothetical protein